MKRKPTDVAARTFLADLLCFAGDLDRADKQLDLVASQDSTRAVAVSQFRQVLRAEAIRRQCFEEGRLPQFLLPPPPPVEGGLRALTALRAGDPAAAAAIVAEAEAGRSPLAGRCNDAPFEDFRDADDITANLLEVLTANGQYYWVPFSSIVEIVFHPPQRPRDLMWRRARLSVRQGPDGEVFVPALYPLMPAGAGDTLRLGHATEWSQDADGPVRGSGQRIFLAGESDVAITQIKSIRFDPES